MLISIDSVLISTTDNTIEHEVSAATLKGSLYQIDKYFLSHEVNAHAYTCASLSLRLLSNILYQTALSYLQNRS